MSHRPTDVGSGDGRPTDAGDVGSGDDRPTDAGLGSEPATDGSGGEPATDGSLETDLELAAIVAVAENGVIGVDGGMPWHLPADLKRFKRLTTGHPVIVGRVTYESVLEALGEPFPGRTTVVLTRREPDVPAGVVVAGDPAAALAAAERDARERGVDRIFVAGGATVYERFLPATDRLFLTRVDGSPDGDTRFPDWDRDEWRAVDREDRDGFSFHEYVRQGADDGRERVGDDERGA